MDSEKITKFMSEIDQTIRRNAGNNSRGGMFAKAARNLILNAYANNGGAWKVRIVGAQYEGENTIRPADTTKADKLMSMSFDEAIYGAGRYLLHK